MRNRTHTEEINAKSNPHTGNECEIKLIQRKRMRNQTLGSYTCARDRYPEVTAQCHNLKFVDECEIELTHNKCVRNQTQTQEMSAKSNSRKENEFEIKLAHKKRERNQIHITKTIPTKKVNT